MTESDRSNRNALRLLAAGCVAGALLVGGCGAEKATTPANPTPTAVPGGGSEADYKGGMNRVLDAQKGGGGGGAPPPGAPGGPPR